MSKGQDDEKMTTGRRPRTNEAATGTKSRSTTPSSRKSKFGTSDGWRPEGIWGSGRS